MNALAFYVYHRDSPGNPWGPFPTRKLAREYRAMLLRYFTGPYTVRRLEATR